MIIFASGHSIAKCLAVETFRIFASNSSFVAMSLGRLVLDKR